MRTYNVELSDMIAQQLQHDGREGEIDPDQVSAILANLANIHAREPDPIPERAMTLLRDIAMERAIRAAEPGENSWDLQRRAQVVLRWILEG